MNMQPPSHRRSTPNSQICKDNNLPSDVSGIANGFLARAARLEPVQAFPPKISVKLYLALPSEEGIAFRMIHRKSRKANSLRKGCGA
jgi:hypothetical protein